MFRKITKFKSIFSSDEYLHKCLYLTTGDISDKLEQKIKNWIQLLDKLSIYIEDILTSVIM